uniref:Transthyretin-like family protein n=1 Tax=Globodera rostochiensis TaxID=31243 RepID=A0A914GQM2_GLORO
MAFSHLFLLNSLLFLLNFSVPGGAFRLQGVGVKGTLLCNGAFSVHTNAAIFDVDRNPGDADDLLDKGHSDRKGRFVLEGTTRELTNIEPELRILHDCADGIKPCHRLLVIKVPSEYINSGKVHKIFDIGTVDLAEKRQDEQRVCQNDF